MDLRQIIRDRVTVLFTENDLDPGLLEQYPYQVSSMEEFESDLQIMHEIGIAEYYRLRSTEQLYDIVQKFEYRNLFQDEFEETFIGPMRQT